MIRRLNANITVEVNWLIVWCGVIHSTGDIKTNWMGDGWMYISARGLLRQIVGLHGYALILLSALSMLTPRDGLLV